jgi:hypothetical protein
MHPAGSAAGGPVRLHVVQGPDQVSRAKDDEGSHGVPGANAVCAYRGTTARTQNLAARTRKGRFRSGFDQLRSSAPLGLDGLMVLTAYGAVIPV